MTVPLPVLVLPHGEEFSLAGNTTIGRSADCSIFLEGPKVSRDHAHIYEIDGHCQVVDSQSRNGTYVNAHRILGPTTLRSGDQISIGGHILTFRNEHGPAVLSDPSLAERTMEAVELTPIWLMVLDIKNSTALVIQNGEENYAAIVSSWFDSCREIIEHAGGIINKSTGDGLLAYWKDFDGTCGELVAQALESLRRLNGSGPEFRMIVHYGPAVIGGAAGRGEEQLSGLEVHFVFRAEKALGQTRSDFGGTEAAAARLDPWMRKEGLGAFLLPGFEGQHQLYRLEPI